MQDAKEKKEDNCNSILLKEIDLIQNSITRMAQNSFLIKGWYITIIVAMLAIVSSNNSMGYLITSIVAITSVFWFLDSFYLMTERKYRNLYCDTISKRMRNDFSNPYALCTRQYDGTVKRRDVFLSETLILFYTPVLTIFILIACLK